MKPSERIMQIAAERSAGAPFFRAEVSDVMMYLDGCEAEEQTPTYDELAELFGQSVNRCSALEDDNDALRTKLAEAEAERDIATRERNDALASQVRDSSRAQSDDGKLREALGKLQAELRDLSSANGPTGTAYFIAADNLRRILASHPAPSASSAQVGETRACGDSCITFDYSGKCWTCGRQVFVREPEEDGATFSDWHTASEHYRKERDALRARIDKAERIALAWKDNDDDTLDSAIDTVDEMLDALGDTLTTTDADTATIPGVEWDGNVAFVLDQDKDKITLDAYSCGLCIGIRNDADYCNVYLTRSKVQPIAALLTRFASTGKLTTAKGEKP